MINPEFVERDGMQLEEEGCLSVPGFTATVRPAQARASCGPGSQRPRAYVEGKGLLARALQHEIDHLDGMPVRRSAARHQAPSYRPQDSEAEARRQMVTHAPLRVVFFGTPEFAVPTLADPDRVPPPRRRRRHAARPAARPRPASSAAGPVKVVALEHGIPVLQPEKMRDEGFAWRCAALDADLGVVAAYGRILTDAMLAVPRLGMINVHASLLPR